MNLLPCFITHNVTYFKNCILYAIFTFYNDDQIKLGGIFISDSTMKVENVEEKENGKYFPRFTTGCGVDCGCHLRNKKIYKEEDLD